MTSASDHISLADRVRLSPSVAIRAFPEETIALNLATGVYHGLNGTAARMIELATAAETLAEAAAALADEYGVEHDVVARDLLELCRALADRELIEASPP